MRARGISDVPEGWPQLLVVIEFDVAVGDRVLRGFDTGGEGDLVVVWHHGTPNVGAPPRPLFESAEKLGIRWIGYDRPGYGGSSPHPDRSVATAALDVAAVTDHLGVERYAVMGHSGGGTHALASAALRPERVTAVVSVAGLAPFSADGLDWFEGMAASSVQSLLAASRGRAEKERFEASNIDYDPEFTSTDLAVLRGAWSWLNEVVGPGLESGPGPLIDDDLAYVGDWGFEPAQTVAPVLLLHGGRDRVVPPSHSKWLADHCPNSELRLFPEDGHLSILRHSGDALDWLKEKTGQGNLLE
jgi:pimeloyl-ACP methyl ester carboxylesterase